MMVTYKARKDANDRSKRNFKEERLLTTNAIKLVYLLLVMSGRCINNELCADKQLISKCPPNRRKLIERYKNMG